MLTHRRAKFFQIALLLLLFLFAFANLAHANPITISGRFVYSGPDPDSPLRPAAGVTVTMTKKLFGQVVSTQTGTADGDGRYFFQGETGCDAEYRFVGTSSLLVDGEPLPDSAPETVFGCLTSDFTFPTGEPYDCAISYPNHIILAGYVRDQLGAPVPGIPVTLTRTKYDLNVVTTTVVTTDVNGRYLFDTYARCSVTIDIRPSAVGAVPGAITASGCFLISYDDQNFTVFRPPGLENAGSVNCNGRVGRPVNVTNGNVYLQQNDFQLPGAGEAIAISRTYNSISQNIGLFGRGWTTQYDERATTDANNQLQLFLPDGRMVTPTTPDFHGQIVKNGDGSYTVTFKDGRIHRFDLAGKLTSLSDRHGNQTVLTYVSGKLSSIRDPFARILTVTANANGLVSSISDSLGTIATYTYGPSLELSKVTYGDNSRYQYSYVNVQGGLALASVTDALGNIIEQHAYDSVGRATTSVTHGGVEKYTLNYVSSNETDVTDGLGRLTKYFYSRIQGRTVVTEVDGVCACGGSQVQTWSYDNQANVTAQTDALGNTRTFTYDTNGNPLTQTDATGTVSYSYNSFGELLTRTDQLSGVTTNTFDATGNLLSTTDALNHTTSFTYNVRGQLLTMTNARGNVTTLTWDSSGRLTQTKDALNNTNTFAYDARARRTSVTNALNFTTSYSYDLAGRVNKTTRPNNTFIAFTYDLAGRRTKVTDALNNSTTFAYDGAYRLTTVTDAALKTTTYTYDLMSKVTSSKDELAHTTNYEYDGYGRLVKTIYPAAITGGTRLQETVEYDAVGNVVKQTDASGRVSNFLYDSANRLVTMTDPALQVTHYEYDARSNLTAIVDAISQRYTFEYDARGRLLTTNRAGLTMSFAYDPVGNRTQRTDYSNMTTVYTYDALDRLTQTTYPDASIVTYGYDKLSEMISAANINGTVSFVYDNLGRVTSTTDVWGQVLNYTYDGNDRRTKLSFGATANATYAYDAVNRLTKITDSANAAVTFAYDAASKLVSRTLPNGVAATYTYDGLDRLTRLKDAKANTVIADNQYSYNNTGGITQNIDQSGTHSYGYDSIDRLISATYTGTPNETYAYDGAGNRTSSHKSATYGYQPFNRLVSTSSATYLYNNNGNMISKSDASGTTQFAWDFENRLTQVVTPASGGVSYKYDGLGRRVQRTPSNGIATNFTYDGQDVVRDSNSDGSIIEYLNGPGIDTKIRQKGSSTATTYYFSQDHLGSTTALTGTKGQLIERTAYDAFGNSVGSSLTRYGFTGRERDPLTGLGYNRARTYDPQLGRFISEDPIGFGGRDINLYGYVWQNPLSFRDPLGRDGWGNDFADWADKKIESLKNYLESDPHAVNFNTAVNYATNVYHGTADLFRVGSGVGNAIYNPCAKDPLGDVLADVGRASTIALTLAGPAAGALGSEAALARGGTTTVIHFTDEAGAAAISRSGTLGTSSIRPFVTLPSEIPPGATASTVESLLEIAPGRGNYSVTVRTPTSNLSTPFNGPTTSGGAIQFQLTRPVPVNSGNFVPTPR